jgi:hypothetical protein
MCQYAEYEVKSAYIFNFAKFIQWPENVLANDTITIAIYKTDPFGVVIDKTMTGRKANGKIWKIVRTDEKQELRKYQIVFFSEIDKYSLTKILNTLKDKPVVTIGDGIPEFCQLGGVINFTPQFAEYQFEINNDIAKMNNIIISPKLLVLAKIISSIEDEF